MVRSAGNLEFERPARLRDRLTSVRKAIEKQQMVAERNEDLDVVGIADDDLEAAVQGFFVRRGALVAHVLEGLYDAPPLGVPRLVVVPTQPDDPDLYTDWLSHLRGSNVEVRVPRRGDKRELQVTVTRNASEEFNRHRLRRASDHNARAKALNELQDALDLPEAPLRIECYDMSHIQGSDYVGSMVVMEDALPRKSEYRRFKVREVPGNDGFAAMEEVLTRRLTAYMEERAGPVDDLPGTLGDAHRV